MTTVEGQDLTLLGPPLLLREVTGSAAAAPALGLLASTDPAWPRDERPRRPSQLFSLADPAAERDEPPAAAALTVRLERGTVELVAFSVQPGPWWDDIAGRAISAVADSLRAEGHRRLVACSAGLDDRHVAALRAAGFQEVGAASPGGGRLLDLFL